MTLPMGLARYKVDELEWITRTQVADSFLFVRADGPFKTVQELFKHAEANPGKLRVGATGLRHGGRRDGEVPRQARATR